MKEELETYLQTLVDNQVFPGCNYGIVTRENIYCGSVGYQSFIPEKIENKLDNLYDIASITKLLVTNTLVSFLLRDKKIKLEDYVVDYLEEFPFKNVQILHLLTHSSGLIPTFDKFHLTNKQEFLTKIKQEFEPGTDVKYVDIHFILLGFIIEKIYEKPLDLVAYTLIFQPLEMKDTRYNPIDKEKCVPMELTETRGLVWGTVHDEKAAFLDGIAGHAGIFSTVTDMTHFISMILSDGYYKGEQFLDKTYLDLWFTPLFMSEEGIRRTIGWVYGKSSLLCKKNCGEDTIIHTGFPGHHILIDRTNDMGLIFFTNSIHPNRDNPLLREKRPEINEKIYELLEKYHQI